MGLRTSPGRAGGPLCGRPSNREVKRIRPSYAPASILFTTSTIFRFPKACVKRMTRILNPENQHGQRECRAFIELIPTGGLKRGAFSQRVHHNTPADLDIGSP
jgi:hypothetical protein